jgi:hypothetical protein
MSPYILAGILAGVPLLIVLAFRVHSSAFFISISAGYLLSQFASNTAGLIDSSFVMSGNTGEITKLIIFLLPIVLTVWLMRGTMPGRQLFLHTIPQVGNSLLLIILLLPLLPQNLQDTINSNPASGILHQVNDLIVAITVLLQLFIMVVTSKAPHTSKHKK